MIVTSTPLGPLRRNFDAAGNSLGVFDSEMKTALATMQNLQGPQVRAGGFAKHMATSGGAGGGATTTFAMQQVALRPYKAWRPWFINYATAAATISSVKGAGSPTDLNDGSALTFASAGTNIVIPAAVGAGATQIAPGIAPGNWVTQSSVPRTDSPAGSSLSPLLQVRALPSAAGTWGFVGAAAPTELFSTYGLEYAAGSVNSDQVGTTGAMTISRGGFYYLCFIEFMYDRPVKTVATIGDSLLRGQTDSGGTAGFRSLDVRVCALKNAEPSATALWSPLTFCLSGQQHASSYQTAVSMFAAGIKPTYLIFRAFTVNDTANQVQVDADYVNAMLMIDLCRANGTIPVPITTGGTDTFSAAAAAIVQDQNTALLRLRAAGGLVVSAAETYYDSVLHMLPAYRSAADVTNTHGSDALYDGIARQAAQLIS